MIDAIRRVFSIPELRAKIFFTLSLLAVCRIGAYISVPGINADVAITLFKYATGGGQNLFQLVDIFSGGAFAQMTVFALGVMPYISASIILQVLITLIPSLQREIRESPDQGRRKLSKWTRLATLCWLFSSPALYAKYAVQHERIAVLASSYPDLLDVQMFGFPWLFYLTFMATMTAGTFSSCGSASRSLKKGLATASA